MKYSHVMSGMHFGVTQHGTEAVLAMIYAVVGLWFIAATIGGMMNLFSQPGVPPVNVGVFLLVPIAAFILAYLGLPAVRQALDSLPLWGITLAHLWRLVGIGFVIGAMIEVLPPQFGYPEGIGDIVAAGLCLPLALALRQASHTPRLHTAFVAWNIFGLLDLLSAITLGILYSPSSFGILRSGISTGLMTTFPVSLIPTFFLPLFILLHLLALKRHRELVKAAK